MTWISISDDDVCASCRHLLYRPGELSFCRKGFPGETNEDNYFISCKKFDRIDIPYGNIEFVNLRICKYLWEALGDIACDDKGYIQEWFIHWAPGTHRHEVWHWFEATFGIPAGDLINGRVP